jgi:hypothetical protein
VQTTTTRYPRHSFRRFFECGTASRVPSSKSVPQIPFNDFVWDTTSPHRTSKPRDFILAIMPQYACYTVPINAKSVTFPELFIDCFSQLWMQNPDSELAPLVAGNIGAKMTPDIIPDPVFLSDVINYFTAQSCSKMSRIGLQ